MAKWWDVFREARAGDAHLQAVCARYSRMLEGARAQTQADKVYDEELVRTTRVPCAVCLSQTTSRPGTRGCERVRS